MLRTLLRRATGSGCPRPDPWRLTATMSYSSKDNKSTVKKAKKGKDKNDPAAAADDAVSDVDAALFDEKARARRLQADENDPSLDVGPNGRPLFTATPTLSQLTRKDACSYFKLK